MSTMTPSIRAGIQVARTARPDRVARRLALLTAAAAALGLCVAVFGAYVRLSDAGLSCPDWPGCYGQLLVPSEQAQVASANDAFPDRPVDAPRAWLEMIHRYAASLLGLVIVVLWAFSLRYRHAPRVYPLAATGLLALVVLQGLLGMWTVTLMLKPIVVTGHLLGGFTTVALLWWLTLRQWGWLPPPWPAPRPAQPPAQPRVRPASVARLALFALGVLYIQLTLGAWTSTNYAALACPDFPLCQGQIVPKLALADALHPWQGAAETYEGGVLGNDARVTIHFLHRMGAIFVTLVVAALVLRLWRVRAGMRPFALLLGALLALQLTLGISNIVLHLPIEVAIGHNAGAALLLLALVSIYYLCRGQAARDRLEP